MSDLCGNHIVGFPTRRLNYSLTNNNNNYNNNYSDQNQPHLKNTVNTTITKTEQQLSVIPISVFQEENVYSDPVFLLRIFSLTS